MSQPLKALVATSIQAAISRVGRGILASLVGLSVKHSQQHLIERVNDDG